MYMLSGGKCYEKKNKAGHHGSSSVCVLSRFSRVRLCDSVDCSLPGSSVHRILQARILE